MSIKDKTKKPKITPHQIKLLQKNNVEYDSLKEKVIEHLKLDAVYFPFEDIRGYKHLLSMQEQVPIPDNVKEEYYILFQLSKEQCEILLSTNPNHEDSDLWQEAIDEINKIID